MGLLSSLWLSGLLSSTALAQVQPETVSVTSDGSILTAELVVDIPQAIDTLTLPLIPDGSQHAWVPWMKNAVVSEQHSDGSLCAGTTRLPWPLRDRTWTVVMHATRTSSGGLPQYSSTWDYVPGSGNIAGTSGSWSLRSITPDQTRLELRGMVDLGMSVPGAVARWAQRKGLPELLSAYLRAVEVDDP